MSDETQDKPDTDKPQPEQRPITLTIRIMSDLSCQVEGPIYDKVLAYGMLASAQDVIREFHIKQQSNLVQPNGHHMLDFVRKMRK